MHIATYSDVAILRLLREVGATLYRLVSIFALTAVVTACSGDTIGTDTTFKQASSKEALVIMGVKSNKWYGFDYNIGWAPFDRATRQYGADGRRPIIVGRSRFEIYSGHGLSSTKYLIFKAKPGAYLLRSSSVAAGRSTYTVTYRPGTVAIDVSAGQIMYIGDYIFVLPKQGLFLSLRGTTLRFAGRSDKEAKKALSEYSNVTGKMEFAKPTPVKAP